MRSLKAQGWRFLVAGGANALATYLLYLLLLRVLPYPWAYSLSYLAGILLSFFLNSLWVFKAPLRWRKLLAFPFLYLFQYSSGLAILAFWVRVLGLDPRLGPPAVLAVTVPVSFVLTRWVVRDREPREERIAAAGKDERKGGD